MGKLKLTSEWYFEYEDAITGPFLNSFPPGGLEWISGQIRNASSPYLVVGDDTDAGFVIDEVFRKPVSVVTQDDNMVRFRTQLLTSECNGDHQKTCIFVEAGDSPETGIMLNMLNQLWSKTDKMVLAVECRITVQGAV
ncbi:MAG: hypothetical protein WC187_04940 [Bacillota bacterium]